MKLDVIQPPQEQGDEPWYSNGLKFTCTECGNCCTGAPGYVWISREEIVRLSEHLKLSPQEVVDRYCRKIDGRFSLKEHRTPQGNYDCTFLREVPVERPMKAVGKGGDGDDGQVVEHTKRICTIYSVRPLQCRTWPFWAGNLATPESWERAGQRCSGINSGRTWSRTQIETLRDAEDWPADAPGSSPSRK